MQFHGYGLLVGIAIVVGWWWSGRQARRLQIDPTWIDKAAGWAIAGGLIGARTYHVIDYWDYYGSRWIEVFWVWQGGLAIWGAIIGGAVGVVLGLRSWAKAVRVMDAAALGLPLSQAIGRWGNWINGELYGIQGQPLFAYEALLNLGLFWGLNFGLKWKKPGMAAAAYLVGYGLIRGLLEPLRSDPWMWGRWPAASWISGTAIVAGSIVWVRGRWKRKE
jgi:phosphatidylglycerol:prolipoprotein diacylglycerol transferase